MSASRYQPRPDDPAYDVEPFGQSPTPRHAIVRGFRISERSIAAYMPDNYSVMGLVDVDGSSCVVINGYDVAGWTLDGYVIPRLASGLWFAVEVPVDDPAVMRARGAR